MKHKHYDMIVAKAENMDLVVFRKTPESNCWSICRNDWMPTDLQDEYFLCLPQHREACLHWLNGGEVQWGNVNHEEFDWYPKDGVGINDLSVDAGYFTDGSFLIRIKPKKKALDCVQQRQ